MMAAAAQLNQASASNWDLSDTSTEAETEAQPLTSAEAMEEEKFRWQQWKEPPVYENDCGDDFLDAMKPVGNGE